MNDTLQDISKKEIEVPSVIQHVDNTVTDRIPVSPVSTVEQHRHITHTEPEHTQSNSVMEKPGPYLTSPQGNTDTGLPGPSAEIGKGQRVAITQQEINKRERTKIIEGCGLASSDEGEANKIVQP